MTKQEKQDRIRELRKDMASARRLSADYLRTPGYVDMHLEVQRLEREELGR